MWNRHAQRALDAAEPGGPGAFLGLGDLLQEIAAEGVVRPSDRTVGLAHELRDQVQVPDGAEERGQIAKRLIDVDLLQIGLGEPLRIRGVLLARPVDQRFPSAAHPLPPDTGAPLVVLVERYLVFPGGALAVFFQLDRYLHVGILARGEAANAADPAAAGVENGLPEAAARERDVPEKTECIQEVRLPGGVRAHKEQAVPKGDVHLPEVLPVPQAQPPEPQILAHRPSSTLISCHGSPGGVPGPSSAVSWRPRSDNSAVPSSPRSRRTGPDRRSAPAGPASGHSR